MRSIAEAIENCLSRRHIGFCGLPTQKSGIGIASASSPHPDDFTAASKLLADRLISLILFGGAWLDGTKLDDCHHDQNPRQSGDLNRCDLLPVGPTPQDCTDRDQDRCH